MKATLLIKRDGSLHPVWNANYFDVDGRPLRRLTLPVYISMYAIYSERTPDVPGTWTEDYLYVKETHAYFVYEEA